MAKIRLSESELRSIIRKKIIESISRNKINEAKTFNVDIDLETDDYIPFTVTGRLYNNDEVESYWLTKGSYDPMFESEINEFMLNNDDTIREKLLSQAFVDNEIGYDEHNEYEPENFLEGKLTKINEETVNDFFSMLEKDPRKKSFAYVYYTMPVSVNKFIIDENGNKIPNPMVDKLFKNKQIKFNYAETFKEVMNKRNPDYVLGKKSGTYENLGGYDVIESGKNGLYMPVLPKSSRDEYSIFDNGNWRPVKKEEIQKYLKPATNYVDNGKPIVNQLIVDRIARISAGGHVWNNPHFIYKYLGPKQETFE